MKYNQLSRKFNRITEDLCSCVLRCCKMVYSTRALCALQVVELEMHSGTVDICFEVAEVFA